MMVLYRWYFCSSGLMSLKNRIVSYIVQLALKSVTKFRDWLLFSSDEAGCSKIQNPTVGTLKKEGKHYFMIFYHWIILTRGNSLGSILLSHCHTAGWLMVLTWTGHGTISLEPPESCFSNELLFSHSPSLNEFRLQAGQLIWRSFCSVSCCIHPTAKAYRDIINHPLA